MPDFYLHLEPAIEPAQIDYLEKKISQLAPDEQLTIVLEAADAHEADRIMELLAKYNIDYQPRGSHDGRLYYVIGRPHS